MFYTDTDDAPLGLHNNLIHLANSHFIYLYLIKIKPITDHVKVFSDLFCCI